jgi:hypothetical protein
MMLFLDGSHYPNTVLEAKSLTVTDFQYITLKQMLLPRYEKSLLWMSLHENHFSRLERRIYPTGGWEAGQPRSNGRISSKQIGTK